MQLLINNIEKEDVLTSYNFARSCDFIYAEALTPKQFEKYKNNKQRIYHESERRVIYKNTEYLIKEGDIIFCHTDFIPNLFSDFKQVSNLSNLTLLTNQTDTMIQKKHFKKLPSCFSNWYSINIDLENKKLISIPLGLSNDYSPKNLKSSDYQNLEDYLDVENISMYINFRNTNFKERELLYSKFENFDWVTSEKPKSDINEYLKKLSKHTFVLSPWGNGVDTHRIWETLYAGSIPITKNHTTFSNVKDLPIMFVESYDEITFENLNKFVKTLNKEKFYSEKLKVDYWTKLMRGNSSYNGEATLINEQKFVNLYLDNIRKINHKYKSYIKKLIFQFRKIRKIKKFIKSI